MSTDSKLDNILHDFISTYGIYKKEDVEKVVHGLEERCQKLETLLWYAVAEVGGRMQLPLSCYNDSPAPIGTQKREDLYRPFNGPKKVHIDSRERTVVLATEEKYLRDEDVLRLLPTIEEYNEQHSQVG